MSYRPAPKWKSFRDEPEENSAQLDLKRSGKEVEAMIPTNAGAPMGGIMGVCYKGVAFCEDKVGANLRLVGRPSKGVCS